MIENRSIADILSWAKNQLGIEHEFIEVMDMYREFEAELKAGGYPTPTYTVNRTFGMNHSFTDDDEMIEAAKSKIIGQVAAELCMSRSMVKVVSIKTV